MRANPFVVEQGEEPMRVFHDTWLIFLRALRLSLRNPIWTILGLIQPILYLVLFGPLLSKLAGTPGFPGTDAWRTFVPGLLVQLGIFGSAFVGFALIAEHRAGVLERMRVSPASRAALLFGRVLRDAVVIVVQGSVLILGAMLFGLRVSPLSVALALLVVAQLGAAFSCLSYSAAIKLKSEDALAPLLNGVSVPLLLLSGILLPMELAPNWLQNLASLNPVKHIVVGLRAVFDGAPTSEAALKGLAATFAVTFLSLWLGVRTFQAENT
jgi:ABC-2 type transport system permease protein